MDTLVNTLNIEVLQKQGRVPITIFAVRGDIDAATYAILETKAYAAYRGGTRHLLLDLSQVEYISSAGLRTLKYIFDLLRSESPEENDAILSQGLEDGTFKTTHLKLLNPSPAVRRTLSLVGLDLVLDIHSNYQEAIASF